MNDNEAYKDINPFDGLRVRRNDEGDRVCVELRAIIDGEAAQVFGDRDYLTLFTSKDVSLKSLGEATRIQLLGEAMARFLNTGGDPETLRHLATMLSMNVPAVVTDAVTFVSSDLTVEESHGEFVTCYEHFYVVSGSDDGFIIAEDSHVNPMTIRQYLDERAADRSFDTKVYETHDRTSEVIRALLEPSL